jgi:ribonucleoside-diphosphate reductase alpha chain
LQLYLDAWKQGLKTIYYVRNRSLEIEDCVTCSS